MWKNISDLWATLQDAAGVKWQLLGVFVSITLARADWISTKLVEWDLISNGGEDMILGIPSWILGAASALLFLTIWFFSYAHKLRTKIQISRVFLARLRTQGVELRNNGRIGLVDNEDFEHWERDTLEWHKNVYEALKQISVADAEWFGNMDVVPDPRLDLQNPVNTDTHPKRYREHDFQVKRLGEMIRDLWGQ